MQLKKKIYLIVSSYSIFFINTFLFYVGYKWKWNSDKWNFSNVIGPKKVDEWEFNEGCFNLKVNFPLKLAKIFKDISIYVRKN